MFSCVLQSWRTLQSFPPWLTSNLDLLFVKVSSQPILGVPYEALTLLSVTTLVGIHPLHPLPSHYSVSQRDFCFFCLSLKGWPTPGFHTHVLHEVLTILCPKVHHIHLFQSIHTTGLTISCWDYLLSINSLLLPISHTNRPQTDISTHNTPWFKILYKVIQIESKGSVVPRPGPQSQHRGTAFCLPRLFLLPFSLRQAHP